MALGFWKYDPETACYISWHFQTLPVGKNYVCLCNLDDDTFNRLFLTVHRKHAKVVATTELNREDRIGLLLHIIPITHASMTRERLWTTRIPTLQFLCAGRLTLQESDQIQHIRTEGFRTNTYQNAVWFDMFMDNWAGQTCTCDGRSMEFNLP